MSSINNMIESIFDGFAVGGVSIPVTFLYYQGHGEPYVTYQQTNADNVFSADDDMQAYVDYYDFDVYAKGNYLNIVESVKQLLKAQGFMWQPSLSSGDMYETDTGYYHKTLNFAIINKEGI